MKPDLRYQNGYLYEHHGAWCVRYRQRISQENGSCKVNDASCRLRGARHESGKSRSPRLPVVFKASVELAAAQGDDGVGSAYCPKHAGLFGTGTNDGFATRFNDARANEEVLLAELGITHPCSVPSKVVGFDADCLPQLWVAHL